MPMIVPAVAAAVTWVSSAAAAVTASLAGAIATTGISASLSASIAAGTLKFAATALGSLALNAVLAPRVGSAGSPVSFKADPSSPIRGVMGYFGTGGTQAHMRVWGKDNLMISYMVILSLGPIQGISKFEANELQVNFPLPNGEAARVEPYRDKMWMTYKMGLPTDGALSPPPNGGNPRMEWDSNHRTSGYAAAFWTMQNNSKKASYESGVPKPLWTVNGQLLYDPRFDSTQAAIGGSGPQRLNDWRTWGYSENPQVHALNWSLGHHKKLEDGSIDRKFLLAGVGANINRIDLTTFVAGMNVSDANGWKISGEWNSQDDKWQTFAAMLQAGGSSPIQVGAKIGIMTNAPKVPVATITSADVIGNMNVKVMASRRDRFNTVYPRYLNELQNWDYSTAGAVTSTVYTDQDGGEERPKELTYNYVRLSLQAGQLAAYDLANTRESLKLAFPAKPYLVGIKPGDAVLVNDEAKGLVNQKFIVTARPIELMEGTIGFELRSETDSKHPWALGQADRPAPSPVLSPINPAPSVPADESWTVLPQPPSDGTSQPGLVVIGEVPDGIGSVQIQVGPSATGPWEDAYNGPPTTEAFTVNGRDPGKQYWVKVVYYSVKGYPSDPLIKGPFTAPALVSGDTKAVAGVPASTLTGRLVNVEGVAAQTAQAVADLEEIYGDTASAAASAASAAQAASDAIQAKADAIIAQGQAQSASTEAILARADTLSAKNEAVSAAGASASSAAQAGGFRNDAQTAAAAALQQKVEATAAREGAQAAANSPLATSPALSPDAFSINSWAELNGPQNLREVFANNPGKIYPINSTVEVNNLGSAIHINAAKAMARPEGHRFRYSARVRRMAEGGDASQNNVTLFAWFWDANGNETGTYEFQTVNPSTSLGPFTLTADHLPPAGTAWTRTMVRVVSYVGVTAILSLDTQDIESEKTATAAATASVASAAAAAASESAAGQSASASQQDRVAAQTARGQAEGFRDQSSASATTAAGAAATATEQAGLSAAARDAAQGHASSALTSRNQASGFVTDAQAAAAVSAAQKLEAVAARDEATAKAAASATSAANAAASETAAGLSATASQTARTGAETARGQAETYRNETASARDTAVGSAATATTQAGISASSAAASQAAANTPLATSPALSPDAFSVNSWATLNAPQNLRQTFAENPGKIYPINSTVEVNNFGSAVHINTAKAMARPEGHRVRYSARIRRMAEGGDASQNNVTLFAWFWDANGNETGTYEFQTVNPSTSLGPFTLTADHLPPAGTAWTRTMVRVVSYVGVTAVLSLDTQDIEAEKTATDAATASVASASTASTKADEAGASASAASAAKIASELARDNASGSASASATSAGQSLTYRNQAGEFASASSGSATAANTAAGNAQTFASQASTSAGNANTAAINAGVSASYARSAVTQTIPNAPGLSPSGFATNKWTVQNYTGTHDNLENKLAIEPSNYSVVGGNLRITNIDTVHIHACRATSRPSGHKVRCSTTFQRITDGGDNSNNRVTLYAFGWDAAGNVVASIEITSAVNPTVAQGVQTLTYDLSDDNLGANCVFLRTMTRVWSTTGATDVISIDTEDVHSEAAAANSAAAALTQAANATAAASSASISANLASSVGAQSSVINNGRFINWPSGQTRPTGWNNWANCINEPDIQTGIGWNGRRFLRMNYQPWMNDQGMSQDIDGFRGTTEPYNLEIEIAVPFGGATGSGFYGAMVLMQCLDANGNYVGDADGQPRLWLEKDINGNIPGAGSGDGRIYRFNKRVNLVPGTRLVRLFLMSRWVVVAPPGPNEAKTLDWYSVSLTPMSEAESSVAGLASQLQVTASTTADLATRMATAKFEVIAAAGSSPAQLLIRADNSGSLAALVASAIRFSNVVGGSIIEVLRLEGGRAIFASPISIISNGRRTTLGPGIGTDGKLQMWSGPSSIAFGSETVDNGIFGITDNDGYFGGKTLSGPFGSGTASSTPINLTKNAWTTIASVDRMMGSSGFMMARASFQVLLGQANNDGDFGVTYRIAVSNLDDSNMVEVASNYGAFFPNSWTGLSEVLLEGNVNLGSRGNKRIHFQINPVGGSIGSAQARNGFVRGLYGA